MDRGGLYGCVLVGGLLSSLITGDWFMLVIAVVISAALEVSLHSLSGGGGGGGGGGGRDRRRGRR